MLAGTTIRFLAAITTAVTFMGIAAACGGDDDAGDDLPPPAPAAPTPEPSPSLHLSPAEQQAVDEARATFDEFMNAYVKVSTAEIPAAEEAEDLFRQVDQHVAPGALSQELRAEIVGRWGDGETAHGSLTWGTGALVKVDMERQLDGTDFPTVYVDYCIDATDWRTGDARTDGSGGEGGRHLWSMSLAWSADWSGLGQGPEGWRVVERDVKRDRAC